MDTQKFAHWFRHSSPYINKHRLSTFIIQIAGEILQSKQLLGIIHDITLLNSLGCRVLLIFDATPQIKNALKSSNISLVYHDKKPIVTPEALDIIKTTLGKLRFEIESYFSMGLTNSPMAGSNINIISGNLVVAQPYGIQNGIDYLHYGEVRNIDKKNIKLYLKNKALILLSPLGYSSTGELFYLNAEKIASQCAIRLQADKLILMTKPFSSELHELTVSEAITALEQNVFPESMIKSIQTAIHTCQQGIPRTHLLPGDKDGALLQELFTIDGIGTLINANNYENIRAATIEDISGIIELIKPLEKDGTLVQRSLESLERDIDSYFVIERDNRVIGCAALFFFTQNHMAELACFVIHPQYRKKGRAKTLLKYLEKQACQHNDITQIIALSTKASHWFLEKGFIQTKQNLLPNERQKLYNYQRNSKIFIKKLII